MDPPAKRARPYDGPPPFNRTPLVASPSSSSSLSLAPLPSPTFGSFPQEPPLPTSLSGPSRKIKRKPAATGKSRLQDLQKGARVMPTSEDLDDGIWVGQLERDKMGFARRYQLVVRQDPARARLCSFKEENVTTDRRPIDPPPIIEIRTSETDPTEFLECTSLFLRATLVAATPTAPSPSLSQWDTNGNSNWYPHPPHNVANGANGDYYSQGLASGASRAAPSAMNGEVDLDQYEVVKTPAGGEATAGEVVLTPEKLKDLNGAFSSFCVFSKLSVRVPGVFRLKMTLYETIGAQVVKMASVLTDQFEVYSPKRFTGMKESTALTRHFAHQGLKIKLRAGSTVASIGKTKRASSASSRTPSEQPDGRELSVIDEDPRRAEIPRRDIELPLPIPSVMASSGVPFPDLPPYSGSTVARVHLPSIGDLSAFSLGSTSSISVAQSAPPHLDRPPHPLTPWQAPPPHLASSPSESPLATPRPASNGSSLMASPSNASGPLPSFAYRSSMEDGPASMALRSNEMHYSSHPFSSSYPQPYTARPAYTGSHSYPEHSAYHHAGPLRAPGRDRGWMYGGGGTFPPMATAEETLANYREGLIDFQLTHRRRDTASSEDSNISTFSHRPLISSPTSGTETPMMREAPSHPFERYRRPQPADPHFSDGRAASQGYYDSLADAYSSDGRDYYPPGPSHYFSGSGRDNPAYGPRPSSPESNWRSNYVPGPSTVPYHPGQMGRHSPGPHLHHPSAHYASAHPPPPDYHLHHHYLATPTSVSTTLPSLSGSNSSSIPSSSSTVFSGGDSGSNRSHHHLSLPSSLRYDSNLPYPPPHDSNHHASGSSMATRPKKSHSSMRGGLDAHGYSHRPNLARDDGGLPGSVRPKHPFPYPSQPQHQYFPRGGGTVGTTGSHVHGEAGTSNWKEPLGPNVGVYQGEDAMGHDGQGEGYGTSSGMQ